MQGWAGEQMGHEDQERTIIPVRTLRRGEKLPTRGIKSKEKAVVAIFIYKEKLE